MNINSPNIRTFKENIDSMVDSVIQFKADSHIAIYIQSLLNITVYTMSCRFLEGCVKHIIYNCCIIKGFSQQQLQDLCKELKSFNNPEFQNIKSLFKDKLGYDIITGIYSGNFDKMDITFLNEIVRNRHKNVHASEDSRMWYNANIKDIEDFRKEYKGLINILTFLDSIKWDANQKKFIP